MGSDRLRGLYGCGHHLRRLSGLEGLEPRSDRSAAVRVKENTIMTRTLETLIQEIRESLSMALASILSRYSERPCSDPTTRATGRSCAIEGKSPSIRGPRSSSG